MTLAPQHQQLISNSGISDAVRDQRGYFTVTMKVELTRLGFAAAQRAVPALVIPQYDVNGNLAGHQLRPDAPRVVNGKALKYETPKGTRLRIDVPLGALPELGNPSVTLYITEGSRKADAAVSHGLCCVSLSGVWGWRGTNEEGGKVALPDWEGIALNGRPVRIAFDSDVVRKSGVRMALIRLRDFLESRGAKVQIVVLPEGEGRSKIGLDDFLAAGNAEEQLDPLCSSSIPTVAGATVQPPPLARSEAILDQVVSAAASSGCVGEDAAVQLVYLSATSRLLEPPASIVSLAVKGPSSGGKSHLVQAVLGLFPADAYYALTSMSERSLAYSEVDLRHRMLVLYEAAGLAGDFGTYLIRSLLSEGQIRYETVEKTTAGLKARTIEREGPTGLITTTTTAALHPENETRLLSVTVDDTPAQTRRVMQAIAARRKCQVPNLEEWHALQAWLVSNGPHQVDVPYAGRLASMIPPVAVRLRRDFSTLLGLIRAHALLHRLNRPRGHDGSIVATLVDYAVVRDLVAGVFADGVGATVSATVSATVDAVRSATAGQPNATVTLVQLAAILKLDKSTAQRRSQVAIKQGYLVNLEDRKSRPAKLTTGDQLPQEITLLPDVGTLQALEGCAVAPRGQGMSSARADAHTPPAPDSNVIYSPGTVAVLEMFPGSRVIASHPVVAAS
jgi:Domain of unknown function (DUF3854)